jgi:target of rapamycin complex subunit LST8
MPNLPVPPPAARHDMSVILVTGSYDHEIRFWEAWSGICSRTIARSGESGVSRYSPNIQAKFLTHPPHSRSK